MRLPLGFLPLGALLAGCNTLNPVQPAELRPPNPLTRVWVTRTDHTTVVFNDARVSGDTLIGIVNGQRQRVRLSETTVLRAREPAPDRTAALVFFGVSGVVALAVYFVDHPETPPCPELCCRSADPELCL